jgi:hypothetical protein
MEVVNQAEGYVYRGEIATAVVEGDSPRGQKLKVTFVWLAKSDQYPPLTWGMATTKHVEFGLDIYSVNDIGERRIHLESSITHEEITIFPPDGSKLDRSKIVGFPAVEFTVDTRSTFPFFGGEKVLILTAPDHPEASFDDRLSTTFWDIEVQDDHGEQHGVRGAYEDATADDLWSPVSNVLYQTVSSSAVNDRTPEVQAWLKLVVAAYQERFRQPIPLPTCDTSPMFWSDYARQHAYISRARANEVYPAIGEHLKDCESHRRALLVFHTVGRKRR